MHRRNNRSTLLTVAAWMVASLACHSPDLRHARWAAPAIATSRPSESESSARQLAIERIELLLRQDQEGRVFGATTAAGPMHILGVETECEHRSRSGERALPRLSRTVRG